MSGDKARAKKGVETEILRDDLVRELKHLRVMVREVGEQFIMRREGEIETIISHLAAIPSKVLKGEASMWLRELRGLRLKPDKGRIKDLKGIDQLIQDLSDEVMGAEDRKK